MPQRTFPTCRPSTSMEGKAVQNAIALGEPRIVTSVRDAKAVGLQAELAMRASSQERPCPKSASEGRRALPVREEAESWASRPTASSTLVSCFFLLGEQVCKAATACPDARVSAFEKLGSSWPHKVRFLPKRG